MKPILITGGAGYIGSHACKALARAGYTPVAYDNLEFGHEWAVRWGPLERGDILDRARLDAVVARYRPQAVMHFAAYTYVGESVGNPLKYYRNNLCGTASLLGSMRDHGVDKIVFSSTCATYGIPRTLPITEQEDQNPVNPYGCSKLMVERLLRDCNTADGIRSVSLRYFNAAGADPEGEIGEDHDPETHLIPLVLDAALQRRPQVTIYGDDYDTPDGTCIRDYIHVSDLADAHVSALDYLANGGETTAFNLGNGKGFSVREVVEAARRVTGIDFPVAIGCRREGDPPYLIGDSARIQNALGWSPRHTRLEEIVSTAWSWHQRSAGL